MKVKAKLEHIEHEDEVFTLVHDWHLPLSNIKLGHKLQAVVTLNDSQVLHILLKNANPVQLEHYCAVLTPRHSLH